MAMFEKVVKDGIQLGNGADYCFKCVKPGTVIEDKDILEHKEVFKIHINGLEYSLCLEHLQQLLGDYVLVHKDTLVEGKDVLTLPRELVEKGTEKEVIDFIEKALKTNGK